MKAFKSRLTRIKNLLNEKIPDGTDVFGFAGITREMLLATCQEIYELSDQIAAKDDDHHFEIIALKRLESEVNDRLIDFLEHGVTSDKAKDKFDKFLNDLSKLYEKTKVVYFIVTKNGLRDDLELSNLRLQIDALDTQKAEFEKLIGELTIQAESAKTLQEAIGKDHTTALNAITSAKTQAETEAGEISSAKGQVVIWHTAISETHQKMSGWDLEIAETLKDAKANETLIKAHLGTLNASISTLDEAVLDSATLTQETQATAEKNMALIVEIEKTLGDANRVGMAASFEERMIEMTTVRDGWRSIFILVMVLFLAVSIYVVTSVLSNGPVSIQVMLARLSILTPVVWLAWFSARQYGFANKSREDYAFKYSSAMAYEGYRKAVRETKNEELERVLIEIAMYNMALNPIRLYDKSYSDHASPFSAFLEQVFERIPGFKKLKIQGAGVSGEAEAAGADKK